MKIAGISLFLIAALITTLAAFSHRILPADADECQRDVSHVGHIPELPVFHCIGHSQRNVETNTWDHVHPWMTAQWHRQHGFEESPGDSE